MNRSTMSSRICECFAARCLLSVAACLIAIVSTGCQRQQQSSVTPTTTVDASPSTAPASADPGVVVVSASSENKKPPKVQPDVSRFVPNWVAEAVFYQIFPDRFRNGDSSNDPTRESLEDLASIPETWEVSPWTGDWYARADWEKELSGSFFEKGIFDRRYGGDLQGVLDRLDYLQDLGINAIYFNPVFYGKSLHKYDGASMHHIDPYFGPDPAGDLAIIEQETSDPKTWQWTAADKQFLKLVKEIHARDMRVIIDGVFNHTGRDFFAFADLREKQAASPYKDWYIVQYFDDPATPQNEFRYKSWWGFETLPEFAEDQQQNDLHPGPKAYVMDITRRWMDPDGDGDPSDGIDGWRLDVANEVPSGFWQDWNTLVRELNPEAYTVGEFWENARDHLVEGHFSGTMNYHGFAYLAKGFLIDGILTPHDFGQELVARLNEYPQKMQYALQNLIDSHDTQRVGSMIVNRSRQPYLQPERFDYDVSERVSPRYDNEYSIRKPNDLERNIQRLVALMQMTFVGPPMIYYGDEAGMWGADDPCNRLPMVWDDLIYDDQSTDPLGRDRETDTVQFNQELHDFYRQLIHLRRKYDVLEHGDFEPVVSDDDAKFFAFRRTLKGKSVLVAINRGEATYSWEVPCDTARELQSLIVTWDPEAKADIVRRDGVCIVTVPPLGGVVLAERANPE
ncbi:glycoside hydrolase family 13 protein [Bythopirellula goksoeyrii]|uniref:glycoside hydrolase family 13 protein n=1 Tax=Bythopirellula goksoeyrii TaxID=1400387 RepID=UPI001AF01CD7|nr:glycoside hydrolase family 13 protein [Bythopirellula goksoeyrii]